MQPHEEIVSVLPGELDRLILASLDDLPLQSRPWHALGTELGLSESEVLAKVRQWSDQGFFRFLQPFFVANRLGYRSTLMGGEIEPNRVDDVGECIAQSPYVSHSFLRTGGKLNLWFTLTCPEKGPTLEETIAAVSSRLGIRLRRFDTVRHLKISFRTLLQQNQKAPRGEPVEPPATIPDTVLVQAVEALQRDFPLTDRPFTAMAEGTGLSEGELLQAARLLKHRKILRRLGVVLDLKRLGANQNVMCLWDASEDALNALGTKAANHPRVSHCYQRTPHPDWPWKLYTVIHGRDPDECRRLIDEIRNGFPTARHLALWTTREYKQFPVRYDPEKVILSP